MVDLGSRLRSKHNLRHRSLRISQNPLKSKCAYLDIVLNLAARLHPSCDCDARLPKAISRRRPGSVQNWPPRLKRPCSCPHKDSIAPLPTGQPSAVRGRRSRIIPFRLRAVRGGWVPSRKPSGSGPRTAAATGASPTGSRFTTPSGRTICWAYSWPARR